MSDVDPNSKAKAASALGAPSASASSQWHLHIPPETYGPYSVQQLRDYARDGRMTAQTMVWTEGNDAWAKAGDLPALKGIFAAVQPAPPPPPAPPQTVPRAPMAGGAAPAGARAMSFGESVRTCLQLKYAGFQGRARRSEYWWFALFMLLLMVALETVAFTLAMMTSKDGSMSIVGILAIVVAGIVMLGLIVPAIAVAVRRLHDLGWSGWWCLAQLIPIVGGLAAVVMIIGFMMRGNDGPNKYGPDPLAPGNF